MIDRLRLFLKWLIPIVFFLILLGNHDVRRLLFTPKSRHEDMTQAGMFYDFTFLKEQVESAAATDTNNGILIPYKPVIKDPFHPSDFAMAWKADKKRSDLLEGIVVEGTKPYALIAGRRVAEGESVMGLRVISIRNNKVFLASNSRVRIIALF